MIHRSRAWHLTAAGLLAAISVACDSPSEPSPPATGSPGVIDVRGAERLAWFQDAPSRATLDSYQFVIVVDGNRTPAASATCSAERSPSGYECSARLPAMSSGRRELQLVAVDGRSGQESERSAPLSVNVAAPRLTHMVRSTGAPQVSCLPNQPGVCLTVDQVIHVAASVRRIVALPDDRMLLLGEDGVFTTLPSLVTDKPRLSATADVRVEVSDVAAHLDFDATHFLYLAVTSTYPDGRRTVGVVRVREMLGQFGEVATIVPELPMPAPGYPAISAGPDEFLYLAVPGRAPTSADDPYEGTILRYTDSGEAAGHARNGSPVWAHGLTEPSDLLWAEHDALVVWGKDAGREAVAIVDTSQPSSAWPIPARHITSATVDPLFTRLTTQQPASTLDILMMAYSRGRPSEMTSSSVGQAPRDMAVGGYVVPLAAVSAVTIAHSGDVLFATTLGGDAPRHVVVRVTSAPGMP
jgi:hypothetical protein